MWQKIHDDYESDGVNFVYIAVFFNNDTKETRTEKITLKE